MTEPGKHALGLRGFPTPDTAGGTSAYLLFLFDDPLWAQYVLGACRPLQYDYNWFEAGGLSPEEAAEAFRIIVDNAPYNLQSGETDIDTPFWDDASGDDASDRDEPDAQTWYGVWDGETFTEALSYWAVTAFLATGISEGAAIEFITPLRTFRLTLKKHPAGAKLLVLMDSNLFQLIDLYSATDEVVTLDVVSPGSTLMLVHSGEHNASATPDENGNYTVDIIKSRLSESDVVPSDMRYDGDPPVFQISPDGGTTWVDNPAGDVRHNPAGLLPPLTSYSGIECDVAARMTAELKDTLDIFIASGDAAQTATEILSLLVFPFGWAGWLLDVILFAVNQLIDVGQSNIESAFTTAVYDDIQCKLLCFIQPNGQITQAALDAAYDVIKAAHTGTVANVIDILRLLYTDVPMSNAGTTRTETGDCGDCASCQWYVEYDFSTGSHGFYTLDTAQGVRGVLNGDHFIGTLSPTQRQLYLYKQMAGVTITKVGMDCHMFHGTGGGAGARKGDVTTWSETSPQVSNKDTEAFPSVTTRAWESHSLATSFTTTAGLQMDYYADTNGGGYIEIWKIRLGGTGTPPIDGVRVADIHP